LESGGVGGVAGPAPSQPVQRGKVRPSARMLPTLTGSTMEIEIAWPPLR
jgi:hypothetical protein